MLVLQIKRIRDHDHPVGKAYEGDAGIDLPCCLEEGNIFLEPQEFADIPTGLAVAVPSETWGEIRSRSSTAFKKRLYVYPGIIDAGFRGELGLLVQNLNSHTIEIKDGERLAQLLIVPRPSLKVVWLGNDFNLPPSIDGRDHRGFGSTG